MEPIYRLMTNEADYRAGCAEVLRLAEREIRIFDRGLVAVRLDEPQHADWLADFLAADRSRQIRIVLHEPETVRKHVPRVMQLLASFSHQMETREIPDNLRHLADTHILVDHRHGVRRFQFDQPRSALIVEDPPAISPWWDRFSELWEQSHACLGVNATGL